MIRTSEDVRRIIDGSDEAPPPGRQRKLGPRTRTNEIARPASLQPPIFANHTPVPQTVPQSNIPSLNHHQSVGRDSNLPIRRGRTLGLSRNPAKSLPIVSTPVSIPALDKINEKEIPIVYRRVGPPKKNNNFKYDGLLRVSIQQQQVYLMNQNKLSVGNCHIKEFNFDAFNSHQTMSMENWEYMKADDD